MDNTGKQIVFIVCLLGFFFTLVMQMPNGFFVVSPDYDETEYPTYWDASSIQAVLNAGEENISYQVDMQYIDIPSSLETIYVKVQWWFRAWLGENTFNFEHYNWGLGGFGEGNIEPFLLRQSEVLANVDEGQNFSRFLMTCDHYNYITYIGNTGDYATLSDSLDAGIVTISMGVDYNTTQAGLSGGDLLNRLLTLQLPNVTSEISFLIGIPIFALIGFLTFVVITMIVDMLPLT